ncbi:MAG: UbiX family flavin prenyltransferase [Nitrospirae bacterium]|nr:UbiX family flavin prenyltransferase [Nitrospirota bacterium]
MAVYTLAITGASGAIYGLTLLEQLAAADHEISLVASLDGVTVVREETGVDWSGAPAAVQRKLDRRYAGRVTWWEPADFYAPIASGSHLTDGMIIAPCSMKTAAAVAHGLASGLIERAADVTLKERRPLIVVPRETPFSTIHLENLLALARAGAHVVPAMPAFYHQPKSIDDLVAFVVGRILDHLGVPHTLVPRWGEDKPRRPRER